MGFVKRVKVKIPWWFKLEWRNQKILPYLFALEFPFTIAGLALFGIADPDTYRTALWQEGSNHGWNSDPSELLYAAANYEPIPAPIPWNGFISQQAAPDYSDPNHPSKFPWYLQRGCGAPVSTAIQSSCKMAIGSFVVTVCMSAVFLTYIIVSIIYAFPTAEQKEEAKAVSDEEAAVDGSAEQYDDDKHLEYEMGNLGAKAKAPYYPPATPRTQAFHALEGRRVGAASKATSAAPQNPPMQTNRDLPLRHHISMGNETYGKTRFA